MRSEWNASTIGESCSLVTDGSHFSPKSVENGEYMVSVKDFTGYGFDFKSCRRISREDYETLKINGCVPKQNDILIGKDGARYFEDIVIYRQPERPALLSSIAILRCDEHKILPEFLYYILRTPSFRQYVRDNYGSGSAIPRIILRDFKRMPISYPSLEEQKKVASVLTALDSRIRINEQINDNLQQQAATLFKALFVDLVSFDGTMPSNWTISTLGDVTEMSAGGDKPKESSPIKTPLYRYPIYSNGINDYGLYGYTNEPKIKVESVTVSARGTIGYVCLRHIPYVPIVRLVTLIPDTSVLSAKYLYLYLRQLSITGTGTTQQQLTVPDFRKTEIIIPDKKIMDSFTETVTPLFEQIRANEDENIELAELRDALLPKLMSGEIDVSDVQL